MIDQENINLSEKPDLPLSLIMSILFDMRMKLPKAQLLVDQLEVPKLKKGEVQANVVISTHHRGKFSYSQAELIAMRNKHLLAVERSSSNDRLRLILLKNLYGAIIQERVNNNPAFAIGAAEKFEIEPFGY